MHHHALVTVQNGDLPLRLLIVCWFVVSALSPAAGSAAPWATIQGERDCSDYPSQAFAQIALDSNPDAATGLDPDGNGIACDSQGDLDSNDNQISDCTDFETQADAQAALDTPDAETEALSGLDPDGDGIACPDLELGEEESVPAEEEVPEGLVRAKVVEIIDGDTLKVRIDEGEGEGQVQTVRLIGIDTPETKHPSQPIECYGPDASNRLDEMLPEGRTVYLESDISDTDQFDRKLRYVWFEGKRDGNGYLVNEMMVREGFAVVSTFPPDVAHVDELTHAQDVATFRVAGLWDECGGADTPLAAATQEPTKQTASNEVAPDERAYLDQLQDELLLLGETSTDLGELLSNPKFGDSDWVLSVATDLVVYQQTYQQALLEPAPPARLATIHLTRLAMLQSFSTAADNFIAGLDNLDPTLLDLANSNVNDATDHFEVLRLLIQAFEDNPGAFGSTVPPAPEAAEQPPDAPLITDCSSFGSFAEANAYYVANPEAQPFLDPNVDGRACEVFFGVDQAVAPPPPADPPQAAPPASSGGCDPSYPGVCIPLYPPDLDCGEIAPRRFTVLPPDPHGFDRDSDGIGCES